MFEKKLLTKKHQIKQENLFELLPPELFELILSWLNSEDTRILSQVNLKNYHAFTTWRQTPKYIIDLRERFKKLTDAEEQLEQFSENKIARALAGIQDFLSEHPQSLRVMGTCMGGALIVLMMYGGIFLDVNLLIIMAVVIFSLFILTMTTIQAERDDWNFIPQSDRKERYQNLSSEVGKARRDVQSFFNENKLKPLTAETSETNSDESEALLAKQV
ncbi:MAG: hypothetical protein BGO90_00845 [Legionella sp. 40-6]|nr:hypothetical protein [Legionella sp.]OJY33274.1 MAG: hypothetical protein BGO90_00845 [Legionella sp. 40-6]